LTESDIDGYCFAASIIILVEEKGEEEIENSRVCIEKLVINDGTYGNQGPGYQISKTIFY